MRTTFSVPTQLGFYVVAMVWLVGLHSHDSTRARAATGVVETPVEGTPCVPSSCTPTCGSSCTYYSCDNLAVASHRVNSLPFHLFAVEDTNCRSPIASSDTLPFTLPLEGVTYNALPVTVTRNYYTCTAHVNSRPFDGNWIPAYGNCTPTACGSSIGIRTLVSSTCSASCCDSGNPPAASLPCDLGSPYYPDSWSTDAWGACSVACGGGVQSRIVSCGGTCCAPSGEPPSTQACNSDPCVLVDPPPGPFVLSGSAYGDTRDGEIHWTQPSGTVTAFEWYSVVRVGIGYSCYEAQEIVAGIVGINTYGPARGTTVARVVDPVRIGVETNSSQFIVKAIGPGGVSYSNCFTIYGRAPERSR